MITNLLKNSEVIMKKITIIGAGYVGMANALFFSKKNNVFILDVDKEKVEKINNKIFPCVNNEEINKYINYKINITATQSEEIAYQDSELIIIAVPTNFNISKNQLDTSIIEEVLKSALKYTSNCATIVIKSTVPIGYTEYIKRKYSIKYLFFSPEFLKVNSALHNIFFPDRIVIGTDGLINIRSNLYLSQLLLNNENVKPSIVLTGYKEAESIKLMSNSFLAMRVAFFNELDSYAETNKLNIADIIKGVCLDSRIGDYYNNPSFGYGGYCLPKDSKQLLYNAQNSPNTLIKAIIKSNEERCQYIVNQIISRNPKIIGVYRINTKKDSSDIRNSAVFDIIKKLLKLNKKILIYEPLIEKIDKESGVMFENNIEIFKKVSDIILANRCDEEISDVDFKVYSRDVYKRD